MAAPVAIRSQYGNLFGAAQLPVLEEMFWSTYEQAPMQRELLGKMVSHDRDIWQSSEMHDLDLFAQISEGQEFNYKRAKQGASRTLTINKYGMGASISREAVEDGKFDMIADIVRKMGRSARESQEISFMNLFNNGFSSEVANDGLSIFNSAHTLPSGTTYRNLLSTAADLSVTSLEQALYDMETQNVGDTGIIESIKPKYLVVNPSNRRYALELIGSDLKADSADNNLNSFKNEGLVVVSSPRLTDSDAWFLVADKDQHGLRIVQRQALKTDSSIDFDSEAIKYKSSYREIIGCTVAKGVFGTPGA